MTTLPLHEFQQRLNARFLDLQGFEAVSDYGDVLAEHKALRHSAGVLDLSFRGRLCLAGSDRVRFLHGQVTNDIQSLRAGQGCYAALVNAKGKMQSDANIYSLDHELLLDLEPGMDEIVSRRLEQYLVADDAQIIRVGTGYGLLSVQGPEAAAVVAQFGLFHALPKEPFQSDHLADSPLGELYLMNQPRVGTTGFDLFAPMATLLPVAERLLAAARKNGGRPCGWQALEIARIEAGIPRFGIDMDESNIPLECGIESRAVNYRKGCYLGQEIINRIHSVGHVNRELRGLQLAGPFAGAPAKGDKLFRDNKEMGHLTSALKSPTLGGHIGLGYVRRESSQVGTELILRTAEGDSTARVVELPFVQPKNRPG